jgi:hypothetical protein
MTPEYAESILIKVDISSIQTATYVGEIVTTDRHFPGICVWGCPIIAGGVNVQCFIQTPRTQGNRIGQGRWRVWGSVLDPRKKGKYKSKTWFPLSYLWSFISFLESVAVAQVSISGAIANIPLGRGVGIYYGRGYLS